MEPSKMMLWKRNFLLYNYGDTVDGSEIRRENQLSLVVYTVIYDGFL